MLIGKHDLITITSLEEIGVGQQVIEKAPDAKDIRLSGELETKKDFRSHVAWSATPEGNFFEVESPARET